MSTFCPYGAGVIFDACNYKHFVPTGLFDIETQYFSNRCGIDQI